MGSDIEDLWKRYWPVLCDEGGSVQGLLRQAIGSSVVEAVQLNIPDHSYLCEQHRSQVAVASICQSAFTFEMTMFSAPAAEAITLGVWRTSNPRPRPRELRDLDPRSVC